MRQKTKSTAKGNPSGSIGSSMRVYGGDTGLVHVRDGGRVQMGRQLATNLDVMMREQALADKRITDEEAETLSLCPGCYMTVVLNALLELAGKNGQDIEELRDTMSEALSKAAEAQKNGEYQRPEHVEVIRPMDWRHVYAMSTMLAGPWA